MHRQGFYLASLLREGTFGQFRGNVFVEAIPRFSKGQKSLPPSLPLNEPRPAVFVSRVSLCAGYIQEPIHS